eukprot:258804-Rhodomonas_salina.1
MKKNAILPQIVPKKCSSIFRVCIVNWTAPFLHSTEKNGKRRRLPLTVPLPWVLLLAVSCSTIPPSQECGRAVKMQSNTYPHTPAQDPACHALSHHACPSGSLAALADWKHHSFCQDRMSQR